MRLKGISALILWMSVVSEGALAADNVLSETIKSTFTNLESLYQPVAKNLGKAFEVVTEDTSYIGAGAEFDGQVYRVRVSRGLLESEKLDPDTFRMILCHEVGHLFGGGPRKHLPPEWEGIVAHDGLSHMTSEGQSDYYAAVSCFRKLAKGTENPLRVMVPSYIQEKCERAWGTSFHAAESLGLCLRSAMAGLGFLQITFEFPIAFHTPDLSATSELIRDVYPARQCRLDTFVQGSLCTDDSPLLWDFDDSTKSNCQTNPEAQRPSCWYTE